ncbi:putative Type I protein exporter [Helianthus anomalus]
MTKISFLINKPTASSSLSSSSSPESHPNHHHPTGLGPVTAAPLSPSHLSRWQLALVTLAVVPLIAIVGAIHMTTLAKLSSKSQEALLEAGNIVELVTFI